MAITTDDFNKIWASKSPLKPYSFSASQYKEGWNFVGATPPSRQMWDFLQKNNDEKMQYLLNNFDNYLPLSGGTLTGNNAKITMSNGESYIVSYSNGLYLGGTDGSNNSNAAFFTNTNGNGFQINAGDGTTQRRMIGKPDGTLTWAGNNILTAANYNSYALPLTGGTMTGLIRYVNNGKVFTIGHTVAGNVDLCWDWASKAGAGLALRSADYSNPSGSPGEFMLFARDANNTYSLMGKPDGTLTWNSQPLLPVGIVQAFAGTTIPNGWLLCDGSAVSRTTYANLYACIGTTYGAGDGSTTFNLPNLVDKFVEGSATAGAVKSAGLPNITGSFELRPTDGGASVTWETNNRAIKVVKETSGESTSVTESPSKGYAMTVSIDASRSSDVYGKSSTVQPPALTMRYIIKY